MNQGTKHKDTDYERSEDEPRRREERKERTKITIKVLH